jgi:hypothetical protein
MRSRIELQAYFMSEWIMKALKYLKARLKERSSWVAIVGAFTVASALPWPWDILAGLAGVIGVMVPEGQDDE